MAYIFWHPILSYGRIQVDKETFSSFLDTTYSRYQLLRILIESQTFQPSLWLLVWCWHEQHSKTRECELMLRHFITALTLECPSRILLSESHFLKTAYIFRSALSQHMQQSRYLRRYIMVAFTRSLVLLSLCKPFAIKASIYIDVLKFRQRWR